MRLESLEDRQLLSIQSPFVALLGASPAVTANQQNAIVPLSSPNAAPTVATAASATPSTVTGTSTSLSVLGADDGGEPNLTYTWAATGPNGAKTPTFTDNGTNTAKNVTATFSQAGPYTFTVTIMDAGGLTTTSSVDVSVLQSPGIVTVKPATATIAQNQTQQFTATELDQFGVAMTTQPTSFHWVVASGLGSISTAGLYTPAAIGPATVTGSFGSFQASASLTVTAANAVPTVKTPAAATPSEVTGTTTALSVLGADDGGEANLTYTWAATTVPTGATGGKAPTFTASGTNAAKNTTAKFGVAGDYTLTVTIADAGGLTVTSAVSVTVDQTATKINVTPASPTMNLAGTQKFSASEVDQFGTAMATQPTSYTWSVVGVGAITGTGATGTYTAQPVPAWGGTAIVTATDAVNLTATGGLIQGSVAVTVKNAAPTVATVAAGSPNPTGGTSTALSVLGADDGTEANLTYTWAATGLPAGATAPTFIVNGTNAAKNTTAAFSHTGIYVLTVTITDAGGATVTNSVLVTVNQTLTSITMTPSTTSLSAGGTQQYTATAWDQFRLPMSPQPTFRWSTTNGTISQSGLLTASGSSVKSGTVMAAMPVGSAVSPLPAHATFSVTDHARRWPRRPPHRRIW